MRQQRRATGDVSHQAIVLYFEEHLPNTPYLGDNDQYRFRMHIKSESSTKLYVVSQRKRDGEWCCSCMGWIRHRHCKHIDTMLPALKRLERDFEHLMLPGR